MTNEQLHYKILAMSSRSEITTIKTILFELLRKIEALEGDK